MLYSLFSHLYLGTTVSASLNTSPVNPGSHPRANLYTGWQRISRTNSLSFISFPSCWFLFNIPEGESISCVIRRGTIFISNLSRNIILCRWSIFICSLSCYLYLRSCISWVYVTRRSVSISRSSVVLVCSSSWRLIIIIIFFTIWVSWETFTPDITRAFIPSKIIFICRQVGGWGTSKNNWPLD